MSKQPPVWANRFLEWFCDPALLEEIQGDLHETFYYKYQAKSSKLASLQFIWLVIRSFRYSAIKINYPFKNSTFIMVNNYLKIAFRNIFKYKVYSAINVLGLALGISATIIIILFARYELTYDQWHENSENTYMLYKERLTPNGLQPTYDTWVPLLEQLRSDFPEIENGTRLYNDSDIIVAIGESRFTEDVYYVDPGYFEVFDFPLSKGDNDKPFINMNSVVISQEIADKFYGGEDPIGKELTIESDDNTSYIVSGIMRTYPSNASVANGIVVQIESNSQYEGIAREWGSSFIFTYLLLSPEKSPQQLEDKFPDFIKSIWDEETQARTNFRLLPLHRSYDTFIGDSSDSYILMYIAFGIILIASINFMNLSTARSMERAKEIGVRKIMGALKNQLIYQFLSEALLMTFISLVIAILFAEMIIPTINVLFDISLALDYFGNSYTIPILLGFGIGLGLLSGSYPAFFLSNFRIIESIKGNLKTKFGKFNLRNVLVVLQFTISIMLIIGTLIITGQINYMKTTNHAFNKVNLIVIPISGGDFEDEEGAQQKIDAFRIEVSKYNTVSSVTTSRHVPGRWSGSNTFVRPDGFEGNPMRMRYTYMDAGFFDTFEIELMAGEGFLPDTEGDQRQSVVINVAAMKAFGWDNIENKALAMGSSGRQKVNVVGLINDFNYESLRDEVQPILHFHRVPTNGTHRYITIRTSNQNFNETLSFIKDKWRVLKTNREFDYFFVEDDMKEMYANEDRLLKMVTVFSLLSIFVSCLGLFGLSSYIIDRRRKEIGIRKVLGASSIRISVLISNSFTKLVIIAFIIAAPIAYFLMTRWLEDFAYKITIGAGVFLLAIGLSVVIAWMTVSIKSMQAAIANPVDSIRDE
jgi:putative ABC transport system permease protein